MRRDPLRDDIRQTLRNELVSGQLRPGEQIRLAPLAERLTVSITPAREALTQLQAEGWVVLHPNRGFFAAPLALHEAEALYPVIAGLEELAVHLQGSRVALKANRLRALNRQMKKPANDPEQRLALDRQWHETLVGGCTNPYLVDHLHTVRIRAERYERAYMQRAGRLPSSTESHDRIIDALVDDRSRLRPLLHEHWDLTLQFLREWLVADHAEHRA